MADDAAFEAAAEAIAAADAMVIGTGAGMGVDSGLGTFRGRNAGVWQPLKAMQVDFSEMSCPDVFEEDPYAAWAFWKYRHDAYTGSEPHEGYRLLAAWGAAMPKGCFSVTSNIDGHWARTLGEERTFEMHGALTHMQRMDGEGEIWPTDPAVMAKLHVAPWDLRPGESVEVMTRRSAARYLVAPDREWDSQPATVGEDGATVGRFDADGVGGPIKAEGVRRPGGPDLCRVSSESPLPTAADGAKLRPNVLMFGDGGFNGERIVEQEERFEQWLAGIDKRDDRLVVVEVGAGTAVPTIRFACEGVCRQRKATLIRLNLDQSLVPRGLDAVGIGGHGALEGLRRLDALVREKRAVGPRAA